MNRRRKAASVAFTGATALATIGLTPGHAHAVGVSKVTVTPGGKYTTTAVSSPTLTEGTNTLKCKTATAMGSLTGSLTGSKLGTMSSASFKSCSTGGFKFACHLKKPFKIVPISPTTMAGITRVKIESISVQCSGSGLFASCKAIFTGSLSGSYHNASGHLVIDPRHNATLTVKTATSGCSPVITKGNRAYFAGAWAINPHETVNAT